MEAAEQQQKRPKQRLTKVGRVVSDKMDKTVVVSVDYLRLHPFFKKFICWFNKFKAHYDNKHSRSCELCLIA